jgi:hypothetical protein
MATIGNEAGKHFDPAVLAALQRVMTRKIGNSYEKH